MPSYEYKCNHCDSGKEERLVPVPQQDNQYCNLCGQKLTLLVSRPAWFKPGRYGKGNR